MERILQFTEDSMDIISSADSQGSGKPQSEGGVESMEEDNGGDGLLNVNGGGLYDGGSGPPSLGSLSLSSQPASLGQQPHSLSVSTGRLMREGDFLCFSVREREKGKAIYIILYIYHSRKCHSHNSDHAHRLLPKYSSLNSNWSGRCTGLPLRLSRASNTRGKIRIQKRFSH